MTDLWTAFAILFFIFLQYSCQKERWSLSIVLSSCLLVRVIVPFCLCCWHISTDSRSQRQLSTDCLTDKFQSSVRLWIWPAATPGVPYISPWTEARLPTTFFLLILFSFSHSFWLYLQPKDERVVKMSRRRKYSDLLGWWRNCGTQSHLFGY